MTVTCDEDCDAAAHGSIRVKRGHRKRAFTIPVGEVQRHLQMNQAAELTLPLTKKGKRRLRKALAGAPASGRSLRGQRHRRRGRHRRGQRRAEAASLSDQPGWAPFFA